MKIQTHKYNSKKCNQKTKSKTKWKIKTIEWKSKAFYDYWMAVVSSRTKKKCICNSLLGFCCFHHANNATASCALYNVAVWTVKSKWRGKNYNIKFIPHRTLKRSELWKTPKTHIENVFSAFGCIAHTMMILYSIYDPQEQFRKKKRLKKISYSNDVTTHSAIRIETLNS